ncbi:phage tail tape measure protein, TP901 family, core region domain-containing protein [Megasphaera sp. BL7]|uniref:phage tail tape measure protein n=1 Tax=unclassified Megasphaera TaxID=2626256 RepID=UPI000357A61F|nr:MULTISPECIES: phage tail tape measure protein [unclassified Megasphaera]EPP15564.1 phage tail tape measure protein, TP901 family, core region domain-containing protein [Megasphaera sp. BL7]EPP18923.1 phage tail tape measure protein, TP901 family, core region domain-containing protein [Megasphaera sp. NM10]
MSNYVLSATLELKDQFTAQVNKARSGFKGLTETLKSTGSASDAAAAGMGKAGTAAVKAAGQADRAKRAFQGIRGIYEATIRAKDDATAKIQKVKTELNGLKGKAYTVAINVKQNGDIGGMKDKLSGMAAGAMAGLPVQAAGFAGLGYGVFDAVKNYSDFTAQLSQIKAVTGLDAEAMDAVKEKALELGADTQFSSTEAAQGMTELLKAGVSVKDVLGDASQAALDLAAAGQLSLPEAAEIMSTAMNAFHMDDATHAADILVGAANASATGVQELKYSLSAVSAVAAGVGMSFDDTNTALAVFANDGLKGSDAGTSLKTMLMNLSPQTKQATEEMQRLGLLTDEGTSKFFDQEGHLRSLSDIAGLLQDHLSGLTDEEKMNALSTLFGSDAIRGGMIMLREGAKGVKDMNAAMKDITAHEAAKVAMDNLRGSLLRLKSAWENLTIKLLDHGIGDGLRGFTDEFGKLTSHFSGLIDDGLQVTDVIKIVGEGIKDLKDKFLAFDGIGSALAGGALIVGLKKIYNLAMKVKDVIQGIPKNLPGGTPTGGNGLPSTSSVKDMVVTATNVIINSKGAPTTAPTSAPPTNAPVPVPEGTPKGTPKPGWGARLSSWAKRVPWIGSAIALGGTALDVAYAPEGEKLSTAGRDAAGLAGSFAGMKGGAAFGAWAGSMVPGVGTAAGAIIGGIAGGIGGDMLGQKLAEAFQGINWDSFSQVINEKNAEWSQTFAQLGPTITSTFEGIRQSMSDTDDWLTGKQAELHQYMADSWEGIKQSGADTWESIKQSGVDSWDMVCQVADEKNAEWSQTFADAKESAGNRLAELEESASTTWEEISSGASSMEGDIASAFQNAKDEAEAAWDGVTGWFEENVWGPLSERARSAWSNSQTTIADIRSSANSFSFSIPSIFSGHATGSSFYAGGWTEINERGGEIVDLPQGSRIYPHATTERMIQAELEGSHSSGGGPVVIKGNTFYVREEADIDRIAYKLAKLISQGHINYGGGY